ncbi:MAG: response regulator [Candidatus Erginobacter occultus]|nr:response regulator [Candidatus Erginobacter occultus]
MLLAAGWRAGERRAAGAEAEMEERLLGRAAALAGSLNPELVKTLTFTASDRGTPAYDSLRDRMAVAGMNGAQRGIYSLVLRDGRFVFGPEDYDPSDPMASPPGTFYETPPPEIETVYRTGFPRVFGPYRDEYGTFVSALAPVFDPVSGDILMLVGIDILADDWQAILAAARRGPLLASLLLLLVLAGGVVILSRSRRKLLPGRLRLRGWIFAPTCAATVILLGLFGFSQYYQRGEATSRRTRRLIEQGRRQWQGLVESEARILGTFLDRVEDHPGLSEAWRTRDREELETRTGSFLAQSGTPRRIDYLSFIGPDLTCFFRGHAPGRFGDQVDFGTLREAARTGQDSWGLELFPPDSFALLYVRPGREAGRPDGFIKAGVEVERLAALFAGLAGSHVVIVIDASREGGGRARVVRQTLDPLPEGLEEAWSEFPAAGAEEAPAPEFRHNDRIYSAGMIPVPDAVGRPAAAIFILRDITLEAAEAGSAILHNLALAAVLGGAILALLWTVAGRAESQIREVFRQVRENEERFRTVFDHAQDGIFIETPEGRIVDVNRAVCELLGYRREELLKMWVSDLLPPEVAAALPVRIKPETVAGGTYIETEEVAKGGRRIPIEVSNSLVRIGRVERVVAIVRDITERKRAQEALQTKTGELEQLTRRLQAALEWANRMTEKAEEASVAKSRFLANMSHEIRTPMNGVLGMTGLLLDSPLNQEQRHYAEIIEASGEALLTLINEILDFSKIEAGRLELDSVEFDLEELLEKFSFALAAPAGAKGLEFVCRAAPGTPSRLKGDPARLRQVLTNLAGNAIKFTEEGSVTVEVTLDRREGDLAALEFSIADTGIGIPSEYRDGIFDPFTQADETTTRRHGGTGLGLAIARQLVELMEGEIAVESEPGRGSTFRFTARFEVVSAVGPARTPGVDDLSAHRSARVLVVDDNPTNRKLVTSLLLRWGMRPGEADSGVRALEELRAAGSASDPYRAAILDMMMPGLDGEELAARIGVDPAIPPLPLVLMTSLGRHPAPARREELGFAAVLSKPVHRSDLLRALIAALDGPVSAPSPPPPAPRTAGENRPKRRPGRILVAEDNPVNQQVARGMLKKLGYVPRVVADGKEALAVLAEEPFDLVLMDVQMPVLDGLQATEKIRDPASEVLDHRIPIVALTAHALKGDRERCLEAGMNDYLPKPITLPALEAILEKWLGRKEREQTGISTGNDRL